MRAASDVIVNENVVMNFHTKIQNLEARAPYGSQIAMKELPGAQVDADLPRMMYIEEQADFLGRTCSFCIPGWRQTKYEATRGPKR